jgi:hypothetical protein
MQAYVDSEPHLGIRARLDHYCDEATFADLTHPSAANQTRDFPPPVQPPPSVS